MHEFVSSSGFRGLAMSQISPEMCTKIGLAMSGLRKGRHSIGHDVRLSSPLLSQALINGLNAGGSDALFLGLAPTPAVAFYSRKMQGGAMITASHNPPEYNGIKLFDSNGGSAQPSFYDDLISSASAGSAYAAWDALGTWRFSEGIYDYLESLASASSLRRNWKAGLDPGNGSTIVSAPVAMKMAGCDCSALNLAPDGRFRGRGSEPEGKALEGLSQMVRSKSLDIGFAYDGDGDRVAVVDESGNPIPQDAALAFVASRMIGRRGGSVVVNIDTSAVVDIMVESAGGKVHRSRVGDVYVLQEMLKMKCLFGGETCGAWIFPGLSLCPDGVLSSIMLLNLLDEEGMKPSQLVSGLPQLHLVRRKIRCPNELKASVMNRLERESLSQYEGAEVNSIDGIRLAFPDKSWVLARPSGTEPLLRVTAEAVDRSTSEKIADSFVNHVERILGDLK